MSNVRFKAIFGINFILNLNIYSFQLILYIIVSVSKDII